MNKYKIAVLSLAAFTIMGCNIFDPFDTPTSDEQLLSAARACFDKGDFECARELYAKLSADYADVGRMEEMFLQLDQAGIGMKEFMAAFGDGSAASGLNKMASLLAGSANVGRRQVIYGIYNSHKTIIDTHLRAFSRFVTSMVLLSEFFAEAAGGDYVLMKDDISTSGTACKALNSTGCLTDSSCGAPTSGLLADGTAAPTDFSTTTTAPTVAMNLFLIKEAAGEVAESLTQLSVSGKFSSGTFTVLNSISAADISTAPAKACFRYLILSQGIGN